ALLAERRGEYEREGIRSMAAIPLVIAGEASGSLNLYYRMPHRFDAAEIAAARALGQTAAAALTAAELYEQQRRDRQDAQRREADAALAEQRAAFLAEAAAALAGSPDHQQTHG